MGNPQFDWVVLTKYVIVVVAVFAVLFDIAAFRFGGKGATISVVLWDLSRDYPIIPFSCGLLMGHLFWRE
jgi:hypothetical protein